MTVLARGSDGFTVSPVAGHVTARKTSDVLRRLPAALSALILAATVGMVERAHRLPLPPSASPATSLIA